MGKYRPFEINSRRNKINQAMNKRLFGRKKGYPLKLAKKKLFDEVFPKLRLSKKTKINEEIFSQFPSLIDTFWLEVGFGNGEHLKWQLEKNVNVGFFCSEPYLNGVASLISSLKKEYFNRIRIMMDDAEFLLELLPPRTISKVFILFPDPWHKKKHYKRRFINENTILKISNVLKNNGEVRIATDSESYVAWILHHFLKSEQFIWKASKKDDFLIKPSDWPATRYENKAISLGKCPVFLIFSKNNSKQH